MPANVEVAGIFVSLCKLLKMNHIHLDVEVIIIQLIVFRRMVQDD